MIRQDEAVPRGSGLFHSLQGREAFQRSSSDLAFFYSASRGRADLLKCDPAGEPSRLLHQGPHAGGREVWSRILSRWGGCPRPRQALEQLRPVPSESRLGFRVAWGGDSLRGSDSSEGERREISRAEGRRDAGRGSHRGRILEFIKESGVQSGPRALRLSAVSESSARDKSGLRSGRA
jgi:hypothetical protein